MTARGKDPRQAASVLIIDDDESTCKSLGLIFRRKGYETEVAHTGSEGLDKAGKKFFNLALLDIRLPDIQGVDVLASLKAMHPDMAVVMVTGYASVETAVRALNEGASGYVMKPLDMDSVLAAVREALEKQRLTLENRRLYEEAQRELAERKKAEEALRRSEARFRALIENASDVVMTFGRDGIIRYESPAVERVLGYKYGEVVGLDSFSFLHPDDTPRAIEMFSELAQKPGGVLSAELRIRHKDGSWRVVEATGQNLLDDPAVRSIVANFRDITERKRAEKTLAASEEKYRALTTRMSDVLWTLDLRLNTTYVSPSIAKVLGFSPEERMRQKPEQQMTPRSHAHVQEMLRTELDSEQSAADPVRTLTVEVEYYHKDGSTVWLENLISAIRDENGKIVGIQGLSRNIAERKRAQEEAARHTRQLEAVHAVARTVSQTLDLPELLNSALERAMAVMGADAGVIYMLDLAAGVLSLGAYRGMHHEPVSEVMEVELEVEDLERLHRWSDGYAPLSQVQSERTLAVIQEGLRREEIGSFAAVPLWTRGELRGVLGVGARSRREFTAEDVGLLTAIGSEIAVGIENARLLEKTRALSVTDEMTGLYNRRRFYEVVEVEMSRTQRCGQPFSIVILDLDGFKEYNDRLGHTAGDAILRSVAETLETSLRKTDTAFRYGGDEFAIMLPGTDARAARAIVERVRSGWSSVSWARYGSRDSSLGFSAGIAQFPDDAETADGLVFLADTALFRAKREGGHKCTLVCELGEVSEDVLDAATHDQVYALAATVDARDPLTYGHSKRVATIAERLGKAVGLRRDELAKLHAAGLLHDIGKVGIPDSILTKPGRPLDREWRVIRQHSAEGARIVSYVRELSALVSVIRHHHEWYDGTGYPDGLKAKEIPIAARVLSIADAFDTMTTPRPYREVVSQDEAFAELGRFSGTQFDPELVEVFVRIMNEPTGEGEMRKPGR